MFGSVVIFGKAKAEVSIVPFQSGSLTYNGSAQSPSWNGYNSDALSLSGTASAVNAGSYTAVFTPQEGYVWSDGTTSSKSVTWCIGKAKVSIVPFQSGSLTYNGSTQSPSWNGYNSDVLSISGTTSAVNAGIYSAVFTPKKNYVWSDGTTSSKSVAWRIGKTAGILSIDKSSLNLYSNRKTDEITFTKAGDGAVSAVSSNPGTVTVSVSGNKVVVTATGNADGSATVTISVAEGTNHDASVSRDCIVTVSLLPAKAALNLMPWADINAICKAGKASEYWSIGDTKNIILSTGEEISVRIEDFNHDTLTSGGKAPITFGMVSCLKDVRTMNSTQTNIGGWGSSAMRTFMGTLLGQFPGDLQAVIKSVTKTTSAGNRSSSLTTTDDKLWLFSYNEVNFSPQSTMSPGGEGTAYPLFISNNSRRKGVNGIIKNWWLRSPAVLDSQSFNQVNSDGTSHFTLATQTIGVAVGFCL